MRPPHETEAAYRRAAFVARESYGRLVAYLATHTGDLAAAEDALSAAFVAALERWPRTGVPERPESWLLTVARRKLIDSARHAALLDRPEILAALGAAAAEQPTPSPALPDERIRLLLVCAHPAIDARIRPALMLQAVLVPGDKPPLTVLAPAVEQARVGPDERGDQPGPDLHPKPCPLRLLRPGAKRELRQDPGKRFSACPLLNLCRFLSRKARTGYIL